MLDKIRTAMAAENIDWLLVFSKDPHLSEYTGACDKYREAISHFTGSAGTILISGEEAYLWTDMRYHIQAANELSGSGITLMKYGLQQVPSWEDFLCEHVWDGQVVAFDHLTAPYYKLRSLKQRFPSTVEIKDAHRLLQKTVDMPKRSFGDIIAVPGENAGLSLSQKLDGLRKRIRKRYVSDESYTYILSDLMSLMWLFNLRGSDIDYVPVAYSYAMITEYDATIFVNRKQLTDGAKKQLEDADIRIREYSLFYDQLKDIGTDLVLADPIFCNCRILSEAESVSVFRECDDTILIPKAYKNRVETEGMIKAHQKDAVTMIRFIRKIKEMAAENALTDEFTIGAMLDEMRLKGGANTLSFETICAYADNCAIVHYGVTKEASKKVSPRGFLLVDSGGQYAFEGTTDITRTISLGDLTDEERYVYTTVLKGNLRLMDMVFPEGFEGTMLDAIAEQPLWDAGYYCGHGIGHGVGCNLSVHESEIRVSRRTTDREVVFRPGAVVSNEPGIYLEGKFGVRIENLLLTVSEKPIDGHNMCRFSPLTLVPFDREAIDRSLLTKKEEDILDRYNKLILERISPLLDPDEQEWLKDYLEQTDR